MAVPQVENLRLENWVNLSIDRRMQALQDMEKQLAAQERRSFYEVKYLPEAAYKQPEDHENLRGLFIEKAYTDNDGVHWDPGIYLNEQLVRQNEPYQAANTLIHESQHAYQASILDKGREGIDNGTYKTWQMNNKPGGYMDGESDGQQFGHYRWQPVEADANQVADKRTKELYNEQFQDESTNYTKYLDRRQIENDMELLQGSYDLHCSPEEVEQKGKEAMQNHYYQLHPEEQQQAAYGPGTGSDQSKKEEENYSYGYGY